MIVKFKKTYVKKYKKNTNTHTNTNTNNNIRKTNSSKQTNVFKHLVQLDLNNNTLDHQDE